MSTSTSKYWDVPLPHWLAHRGATDFGRLDENAGDAFELAFLQGATHIETDVQCTSDGVAVVFHDSTLARVASPIGAAVDTRAVQGLTHAQLGELVLARGGRVSSLEQILLRFPEGRFNIDIKSRRVIKAAARAVLATDASDRVLITSFSDRRRRAAVRIIERAGRRPATSAGAATLTMAYLAWRVTELISATLATRVLARVLAGVDALQIPRASGPMRFDSPAFIAAARAAGKHVHFWVVNDPEAAQILLERGASGIVSDDLPGVMLRS